MITLPGTSRIRAWLYGLRRRRFTRAVVDLGRESPAPFFVKVGAHDGLTGDPCGPILLHEQKWRGLLIEPVPHFAVQLQERFSDASRFTVAQLAVGEERGATSFYFVSKEAEQKIQDLPAWYDQLSSLNRLHIEKQLGSDIKPFIEHVEVAVKPLSQILKELNVSTVDLLQIDTEGHDLVVLRTLDFSHYRPKVIFIEYKHLSKEHTCALRRLLTSEGYSVKDCGGDFFAMRKS